MAYQPNEKRYDVMLYRRCGNSGLKLPAVSLGLWQNFSTNHVYENCKNMLLTAFDLGITHFDLANNYGGGEAERILGRVLKNELNGYRDQLVISTKAGYGMWPGPYGDMGSRKYLISSLDQSLSRMGLDYVDIFYHHRPDFETPLEETMGALASIIQQGKALYVGVSNYGPEETKKAIEILKDMGIHLLIHQPQYSMLNRGVEFGLREVLDESQVGSIAFCPLQQGILTNKYLNGVPDDSRAAAGSSINRDSITPEIISKVQKLTFIANKRGQTLAQMALSWVLCVGQFTSALIGASRTEQIIENVKCIENLTFTKEEMKEIEQVLNG